MGRTPTQRQPVLVLIIEPEEPDAEVLRDLVRRSGIAAQTHVAATGGEAVQCLHAGGIGSPPLGPSLIFLNLVLPDADGLELLIKFKADTRWSRVPVIVVTEPENIRYVQGAYRRGAETFFIKPLIGEDDLISALIGKHLSQPRRSLTTSGPNSAREFCFPRA